MRLGVVVSVYNSINFLSEFLSPWIKARKELDIKIVFVDAKFKNFEGESNSTDGTTEYLVEKLNCGLIDYYGHYFHDKEENEVRNIGINMLLQMGCSHILSSAPDEIFTIDQIKYIYNYIQKDEFIAYYRLNYKNYIGNKDTFIRGFCPKRIWKVNLTAYKLKGLRFDDDAEYQGAITRDIQPDDNFAQRVIPNVEINHYTWLNNETSRKKIEYQTKRGWICSYKWKDGKVVFNPEYYKDKPLPVVYHD